MKKLICLLVLCISLACYAQGSSILPYITQYWRSVIDGDTPVHQPIAGDSTTFFQIKNAAGTTFLVGDSTNGWFGVRATPTVPFEVAQDAHNSGMIIRGYTPYGNTLCKWHVNQFGSVVLQSTSNIIYQSTGYQYFLCGDHVYLQIGSGDELIIRNSSAVSLISVVESNGFMGMGEIAPETLLELTHATPYITLHNSTHEDADGGRESRLNFKGEQSGGEETTLARIEVSHDGAADDEKGKLVLSINDGADTDTPTDLVQLDSTGITLLSTARAWKSEDLHPSSIKHPSANGPGETEYENYYYDAYDNGAMEQIFYLWHIPTDYAAGDASIRGHFGLMVANPPVNPDATEIVAMGFEYMKFEDGEVNTWAADGGGALDISIVMDETAYTWHESATGVCTTTGWAAGDLVMFRFFRDIAAEYSANDDYDGGDALLGIYHLEYLIDKLGEAS